MRVDGPDASAPHFVHTNWGASTATLAAPRPHEVAKDADERQQQGDQGLDVCHSLDASG